MTLRLLHTADWQLGKPYHNLPAEVAPLLREARFAAVRTIAELAARHEAAAILVAGDVFDGNLVPERAIVQALAAMRGFAGPWVLLPGNHDPALAEGVWSRLERLGRPGNVIVAASASPIALADGRLVVLPAPLTERHTSDDLTAWMDAAVTPSSAVRVGLAHGSVAGRLPDTAEAANPIDPERANRAQLDYLAWATGTARSRSARAPGTPARPSPTASVPTTPATCSWWNWPGEARPPAITRLPTARHAWRQLGLDLTGTADPKAALDQLLAGVTALERGVVQLTLTGVLDLESRAALETTLDRWAGELCHLEVRDELVAEPSERDLLSLGESPVIGTVARELVALAAGEPGQRDVASLALRLLYLEHRRLGPGA